MSAAVIRMRKEARALAWPWGAVVLGGVLPLILRHAYAESVNALTIAIGIPLLATLPLGNEFEQRTFALWLAQPANRGQLWAEKTGVMFAAVLSAAMVAGIGMFYSSWTEGEFSPTLLYGLYLIAILCSATFWTLVARSTIGALFLNLCAQWLIFSGLVSLTARTLDFGTALDYLQMTFGMPALAAFVVLYSALMLWLGERKLRRFQLKGEGPGEDLGMAAPSLLPEAWARWVRCRPSGALLNLIRKELRLLRPLWLMTSVGALFLGCAVMLRLVPDLAAPDLPDAARKVGTVALLLVIFLMLAILAGSLSMGEERKWGTHAGQMTLPVSVRRQWLVKLSVAALSGLICCFLLPLLILVTAGEVHGSPLLYLNADALPFWILGVLLASLASFWCACAVNRTAHATVLYFPAILAISYAASGGQWLGQKLTQTTGTLRDLVVSWFHLSPVAFHVPNGYLASTRISLFLVFVPGILFGVMQSYRLYRSQPEENMLWVTRCVLPPVAVSFLCSLLASVALFSSRWAPFYETWYAVYKLQPGAQKMEVTGEELARGGGLSPLTRRWLAGARITIAPGNSLSPAYPLPYRTSVHLASGVECRLRVISYGEPAVTCEHPSR